MDNALIMRRVITIGTAAAQIRVLRTTISAVIYTIVSKVRRKVATSPFLLCCTLGSAVLLFWLGYQTGWDRHPVREPQYPIWEALRAE